MVLEWAAGLSGVPQVPLWCYAGVYMQSLQLDACEEHAHMPVLASTAFSMVDWPGIK